MKLVQSHVGGKHIKC